MGALAADFTWTMEDDFRLRKAAEAGFSLESLARDVEFSKRFTIQELQARWLSILYDPVVSAESSARMVELEHSPLAPIIKSNHISSNEENNLVSGKRKSESIRKRFYAMRKRMRDHNHPLNSSDNNLGFPNEIVNNNEADGFSNYETVHHELNGASDGPVEEYDEFKEIFDLLEDEETELPAVMNESQIENPTELANPDNNNNSVTNNNSFLMEISNTLFDLTMEDDLPLMDAQGNVFDKSYIDGLSSLLLDSPNKDGTRDVDPTMPAVNEQCDNESQSQPQHDHQETKNLEDLLPPSKSIPSTIICTLNTEDPDIPSNDDVFLLNLVPSTSSYKSQMDVYKPPPQQPSKSIQDSKRESRVPKPIIPKNKPQFSSQVIASEKVTAIKSEQEMDGCDNSVNAVVGNNVMDTIHQEETLHGEIVSTEVINPIMVEICSPVDDDEAISSQSDDDIPNYSDVEAMILDEDPSLDEQHLYLNGIGSSEHLQTFKYENADTQKRIIRLEQAVDTFVKRDMTSRGAFAILQGWHMKYYVKKPEVLIGRATEDFNVDIDLGREGHNSRVSRRQAIIHMDREGSFHMKNLSKYPVFVNSVELATDQTISLSSSCLIEIRGMAFLFETNEACIKQYVNNMKNITDKEEKA